MLFPLANGLKGLAECDDYRQLFLRIFINMKIPLSYRKCWRIFSLSDRSVPIADIRGLRLFFYLINLVGIKRHVFDVCFEVKT
ncbi:MAG: hypothetical protein ACJAS1_004738 [Oleiphilaceae bacterium]|jgi:hypothetical protein